jgi:hypothetical protein
MDGAEPSDVSRAGVVAASDPSDAGVVAASDPSDAGVVAASDPSDAGVVQQVALEAIHTLRAFLDLAEVAVTDPELRGQLMSFGREAFEALMPPEQRANVLATLLTVVRSLGNRDGTAG